MGTLKPGATLIHERVGNVVYSREFGADPSTRQVVGWDFDPANPAFDPRTSDGKTLHEQLLEDQLWANLRRASKTNVALQDAMNRAIEIYHLSKRNDR
jgi:hypothetical protein